MTFDKAQDLLRACGYPPRVVVLDAETYFDAKYTLNKLSTYEFVADKRFEIHGWASKENKNPARFSIMFKHLLDWRNTTVIMHNAPFDALILAKHFQLFPPFIIDTLDLARHIEPRWKNKLEVLCQRHGLPHKGDIKQFQGLHRSDFTEQQWKDLIEYACNDAERTFDLFLLLLSKLSNPKFELEMMRYSRDLFLRPTLRLNMDEATTLKAQMVQEVQRAIDRSGTTEKKIRGNKSFEQLLREVMAPEEPPTKEGKLGPLLAIAKVDAGREYLLNHPEEQVRLLMEARIAAKSWPLHIRRIERMERTSIAAEGHLPVPLRYYGAHTGRWSGSEGINLHNLPARGHPLITKIRTLIEAPEGYTLVILDFSQIEARDLVWIAEQNDMVRAYAEGRQIYCEFASEFIGHHVRKPKKTDNEIVAKWHGTYRQMGKIGILGCGYGMGWKKLIDYAKNTFKVDITPETAKKIIRLYRRRNPMVVLFWEKVERAFRLATQTGQSYELSYGLRFLRDGNTTVIQLPSSRKLYYTNAQIGGTTRRPYLWMPEPKAPGKVLYMWGGYLTENIVQAMSRDILAEAVLEIERQLNLRVALIVHDDMSIIAPEANAQTLKVKIEDIARIAPKWAPGLPIDIEGQISRRYIKA